MTYEYQPSGVCSKLFRIEVDDNGTVRHAEVIGRAVEFYIRLMSQC